MSPYIQEHLNAEIILKKAVECCKSAGLTVGTDLSESFITGYELGYRDGELIEAEAHKQTAGSLQIQINMLTSDDLTRSAILRFAKLDEPARQYILAKIDQMLAS